MESKPSKANNDRTSQMTGSGARDWDNVLAYLLQPMGLQAVPGSRGCRKAGGTGRGLIRG